MCHQELTTELVYNLSLPVATITLSSTLDGRQAACPGEVVTYTCTVIQGVVLGWTAAPVLVDATFVAFRPSDSMMLGCGCILYNDDRICVVMVQSGVFGCCKSDIPTICGVKQCCILCTCIAVKGFTSKVTAVAITLTFTCHAVVHAFPSNIIICSLYSCSCGWWSKSV